MVPTWNMTERLAAVMRTFLIVMLLGVPTLGMAQDAVVAKADSGDVSWMLVSSALVLFMTIPGLALFYGGLVRKKNIVSTLMQCFVITCLVTVLWIVAGYGLAFGAGNDYIGLSKFMLHGVTMNSMTGTIPETLFVMYQMTFAIITPALIIGSFVERIKFSGLLVFIALWMLLVYAPIAHMVWGGGLMAKMGVLDFAGGSVVHINAGVAGLIACLMLGKRKEFSLKSNLFQPSNITYTMMGASMLWVGWFGFNAGSALAANSLAAMAMLNTQVAAAAAALTWMASEWILRGKPSLVGISCGAVAGLVAVTPAAGFVDVGGALVIGLLSGTLCLIGGTYLKHTLGYDDSLDVVGVHGFGGMIGALLTGVFAMSEVGGKSGLLEGNSAQLMTQFIGVAITIGFSAIVTTAILVAVNMTIGLRVTPKDEDTGLDLSTHGEKVE